MCLQAGRALGFDPPERVALAGPGEAVAWGRSIPDFGWYPEVYALFLGDDRALRRAAWLGAAPPPRDFPARPRLSLRHPPPGRAAAPVLPRRPPGAGGRPPPPHAHRL